MKTEFEPIKPTEEELTFIRENNGKIAKGKMSQQMGRGILTIERWMIEYNIKYIRPKKPIIERKPKFKLSVPKGYTIPEERIEEFKKMYFATEKPQRKVIGQHFGIHETMVTKQAMMLGIRPITEGYAKKYKDVGNIKLSQNENGYFDVQAVKNWII